MRYEKDEITKSYYEKSNYEFLSRGEAAAIIISGENYRKFTQNFQHPYDEIFIRSMQKTLVHLCKRIPTCIVGYTSKFDLAVFFDSPEGYEKTSWYNYDTAKIATLGSSIATFKFNRYFEKAAKSYVMSGSNFDETRKFTAMQAYVSAIDTGAFFTAKCFNIKKDKISEYLTIFQRQTVDSAVYEMGLLHFDEAELVGKTTSEIQLMVYDKAKIRLDDFPPTFRGGSFCVKSDNRDNVGVNTNHDCWIIRDDFPHLS